MASDGFGRWAHGERGQNFASAARARRASLGQRLQRLRSTGRRRPSLVFEIQFRAPGRVRAYVCWLGRRLLVPRVRL